MDVSKSVVQSLRHARHDFLNELQLIGMYLDLGQPEKAKAIIRAHAEAAVHMSRLAGLGMPVTEEWLLLSKWRYPELGIHIECTAQAGIARMDETFAKVLENFAETVRPRLDPFVEYVCTISIWNENESLAMKLSLNGDWQQMSFPEQLVETAGISCDSDGVEIAIRAQMEG